MPSSRGSTRVPPFKVRDHIFNILDGRVERYPVDGLHFAYVRLASPDLITAALPYKTSFRSGDAKALVTQRGELKRSLKKNPLAAVESHPERFADFQRDRITMLVERVYRGVKKRKPEVTVSAAVFANHENAYTRRFQDWRRWLSMGILDAVCPMAYSTDTAIFQKQIEVAATTAHASGRQVWAGIGAYRISAQSTIEKIDVARRIGADGIILFSYDFTARPSDLNPAADYLECVRRGAFEKALMN